MTNIGVGVKVSPSGSASLIQSLRTPANQNLTAKPVLTPQVPSTQDQVKNPTVEKGTVPQTDNKISQEFSNESAGILMVGKYTFTNVKPVIDGMKLDQAKETTKENGIDEIFFKTEDGKLYVAYGTEADKGSLIFDEEKVKPNFVGLFNNQRVRIEHVENETNTAMEGAKKPFISTWETVSKASENGIVKGVTEIGTTVVALFVGKSLLQNGIAAVQQGNAATVAAATAAAAGKGAEAAKVVKESANVIGKAGKTGRAILGTVKSGVTQVATAAAVAGAVIGMVSIGLAAKGALDGARPDNNFYTMELVTNPKYAFKEKKTEEKKPEGK